MIDCLAMAEDAGGELVRHQGGYWARRGPHPRARRAPWHGTSTVNAIVARELAAWTEFQTGRSGRPYPIALRLTALGLGRGDGGR
jgi:hypothetical protein